MVVADYILNILGSVIAKIINHFPTNLPGLSLDTYSSDLDRIQHVIENSFGFASKFFDYKLFFGIITIIISMEITLFTWKATKYIINLIRGSGG